MYSVEIHVCVICETEFGLKFLYKGLPIARHCRHFRKELWWIQIILSEAVCGLFLNTVKKYTVDIPKTHFNNI